MSPLPWLVAVLTTATTYTPWNTSANLQNGTYGGLWSSGDWGHAVTAPFVNLLGPIAPLVLALGLGGMLFIYSDDYGLPSVVIILLSALLFKYLPPAGQAISVVLIVGAVALALYSAWTGPGGRR